MPKFLQQLDSSDRTLQRCCVLVILQLSESRECVQYMGSFNSVQPLVATLKGQPLCSSALLLALVNMIKVRLLDTSPRPLARPACCH